MRSSTLSLVGPVLTIERFARDPYTRTTDPGLERSQQGSAILESLRRSPIEYRHFRGTGSGKTTLLNIMSVIPADERIVTIENAAELQTGEHVVTLESRPSNIEGKAKSQSGNGNQRFADAARPDYRW
jgi:pilus assembly protein CpaF